MKLLALPYAIGNDSRKTAGGFLFYEQNYTTWVPFMGSKSGNPDPSFMSKNNYVADYPSTQPHATELLATLTKEGTAISIITFGEIDEGIYYGRDPQKTQDVFRRFLRFVDILPLTISPSCSSSPVFVESYATQAILLGTLYSHRRNGHPPPFDPCYPQPQRLSAYTRSEALLVSPLPTTEIITVRLSFYPTFYTNRLQSMSFA